MKVALDAENLTNTLQLFEGDGGAVKANLYEKYELKFQNVFFLIASNSLPSMSEFKSSE